jgi:hypothetical protein
MSAIHASSSVVSSLGRRGGSLDSVERNIRSSISPPGIATLPAPSNSSVGATGRSSRSASASVNR